MDRTAFQAWLEAIAALTEAQRLAALEALFVLVTDAAGTPVAAPAIDVSAATQVSASQSVMAGCAADIALLGQRRVDISGCPHCDSRDIVRWGRASEMPRYRCKACKRSFNALTKTPLARLRKKDKWMTQTAAMIDGVSTAKAAARCDVHYTTAFRWRHRFLASLSGDKPTALNGIVEGDETFILESFKGKRSDLPRKARKRGGTSKRGLSAEQIPVLVARDRQGATTDAVLARLDRASITTALGGVVTPDNEFCCDGGTAIVAFAKRSGIPAHVLSKPGKPSRQAPDYHLNNVNAYHGRLKEWLRRFHGVATKNLPNYLGWRRTLEALGTTATPNAMILGAIGLGPYQQQTL